MYKFSIFDNTVKLSNDYQSYGDKSDDTIGTT